MQLITLFTVLLTALPIVMSHGNNCGGNQFWYEKKSCCLDKGGPRSPPRPPSGNTCKNNEYWHQPKGCCVPRCPAGWTYNPNTRECKCPTPPSPPENPPHPSGRPGGNYPGGNHPGGNYPGGKPGGNYPGGPKHNKRTTKSRAEMCPLDTFACPIPNVPGDFECLDTSRDLVSCGGCASEGQGQDCTTIEFVDNVACENKTCRVYTCESGYKPSLDGKSCVSI